MKYWRNDMYKVYHMNFLDISTTISLYIFCFSRYKAIIDFMDLSMLGSLEP